MRKTIIFLCIIALYACKPQSSNEYDNEINKVQFDSFIIKSNISYHNFKKIIVIPNAGCTGCISSAQQSFVNHYKSTDTLYIFTAIADLKLFKNTLPKNALNSKNVILDTNSTLTTLGFKSIYPSTIEVSNNENYVAKPYQN